MEAQSIQQKGTCYNGALHGDVKIKMDRTHIFEFKHNKSSAIACFFLYAALD